ncbi:MAG: PRC-barrel domain-containing protein [Candidatus Aenigmarchaeota archaeon]|nr:PRC-barrel domain-containing protein [Candidatus Aenigmarchaeota archaeon]
MVEEKEIHELMNKDIFTDRGSFCGHIVDAELDFAKYKMKSIIVDAAKGSYLAEIVGGKRGVIIPWEMVKAVDDVVIVKHITTPSIGDE